jgi:hypothetical protein
MAVECGGFSFLLNGVDHGAMQPALESAMAAPIRIELGLALNNDMRVPCRDAGEGRSFIAIKTAGVDVNKARLGC